MMQPPKLSSDARQFKRPFSFSRSVKVGMISIIIYLLIDSASQSIQLHTYFYKIFKGSGMTNHPMLKLLCLTILVMTLSACTSIGFPGVYRADVDQGNLIDKERLAEVEIGMEPRQVRRLLGTPLLIDTFAKNRWDYFYSLRQSKDTVVRHHITVFFENGRVVSIKDQLKL
jgi:outer membrane protein assembly factor BamE